MTNSSRFYIRTYGCQMNSADSARLAALLVARGWRPAATPQEADLIIVNTCSVRDHAEKRALGYLHSLKNLKKRGTRFGLYGCIANLQGAGILQRYPFLDIICGPNRIEESVDILARSMASPAGPVVLTGESERPFIAELPPVDDAACDVSITKGCDNHCSYCVVPAARGRLVSKPPAQVLDEVRRLADRGARQVTLLGQNVNEYGRDIDGVHFVSLLEKIHEIEGIRRIHFLTSHPKDMPDSLIRAFTDLPKLYRHLHLPLQSGADRILKLMNRRYTASDYLAIIDKVRTAAPDTAVTSDIIVGFPSESETDFLATYGLIERTRFDDLFVFKYSPRPGTGSSAMSDDVPTEEKERRHKLVLNLQDRISLERNRVYEGTEVEVLTGRSSHKKKGYMMGRTITAKPVLFKGKEVPPGELVEVRITEAARHYLLGERIGP